MQQDTILFVKEKSKKKNKQPNNQTKTKNQLNKQITESIHLIVIKNMLDVLQLTTVQTFSCWLSSREIVNTIHGHDALRFTVV